MKFVIAFLVFWFASPAFAQTCPLPPSGEAFCVARSGRSGDFVFAGRVNGSVRCITVQFLNYYNQTQFRPGGLQFWFDSGTVLSRADFRPQRKFTWLVSSVNTWTNTRFYVHRNTCNASGEFISSHALLPSPSGHIDTPGDFLVQPAVRLRNSP